MGIWFAFYKNTEFIIFANKICIQYLSQPLKNKRVYNILYVPRRRRRLQRRHRRRRHLNIAVKCFRPSFPYCTLKVFN